jgi:hypothetical protein
MASVITFLMYAHVYSKWRVVLPVVLCYVCFCYYFLMCDSLYAHVYSKRRVVLPVVLCYVSFLQICLTKHHSTKMCRSQWPRDLRHELSSLARKLRSWVRIPFEAWMSVCVDSVFVLGSDLARGWSLVQWVLPNVRLRNWSETKRFTDALCSKWEQQE